MLSLVIPVYLSNEHLKTITRNCLFSLSGKVDEIIIVDDGSPLPISWLKEYADVLIVHTRNRGFTASVNHGVAVAHNEHVLLINNDTELVSGNIGDLCTDGYTFPKIQGKASPKWDGAFFCFPKSIWKGDDPQFKNYFGDLDRFSQAEKMYYVPSVVVKHLEQQTSTELGIRDSDFEVSKSKFEEKHHRPFMEFYKDIEAKIYDRNL